MIAKETLVNVTFAPFFSDMAKAQGATAWKTELAAGNFSAFQNARTAAYTRKKGHGPWARKFMPGESCELIAAATLIANGLVLPGASD